MQLAECESARLRSRHDASLKQAKRRPSVPDIDHLVGATEERVWNEGDLSQTTSAKRLSARVGTKADLVGWLFKISS
jgi:hypothetical protein